MAKRKGFRCWKKEGENTWVKDNKVVYVAQTGTSRFNPFEAGLKERTGRMIKRGSLTKSQALKFAKAYMKKHNKC